MESARLGVGDMIREAFEAKKRARGGGRKYSIRMLAEESNQDHSLISKVMRGKRPPTREMLLALAGPLAPYFNVDAALAEAEFMPRHRGLRAVFKDLARLPEQMKDRLGDTHTILGRMDWEMLDDLYGLKDEKGRNRG